MREESGNIAGIREQLITTDKGAVKQCIRNVVTVFENDPKFKGAMDGGKCIVQLRGVRPFLSNKFDLTKHPNYPLTSDYSKKNWFDVEQFLKQKLVLKADDRYEVIKMNEE